MMDIGPPDRWVGDDAVEFRNELALGNHRKIGRRYPRQIQSGIPFPVKGRMLRREANEAAKSAELQSGDLLHAEALEHLAGYENAAEKTQGLPHGVAPSQSACRAAN